MGRIKVVKMQVKGGEAKPEPPLGPAITDVGLNVAEIIDRINKLTEKYRGYTLTVKLIIDLDSKNYDIQLELPTITSLILNTANASEPSGDPMHKKVGDIKIEDIVKIAILKKSELTAKSLKGAVKTVLGSARSIGITVEGKDPKDVSRDIERGVYDDILKKYENEWLSR
ncbi:MAG: 50S ribosomal protein L11 [Ignisphaera sp.]|uniref:Large ribosomal subunit protein uL11 n=1 Tax=Ignisphaera aggregans TaxID=334771 RepID=A0A832EQR2_9CREN